jgi:hypothetical protein
VKGETSRLRDACLAQLFLHFFQFSTADIPELAQGILTHGCPGPRSVGCKVLLGIRNDDVLNDQLTVLQHIS